MKKMTWLVLVLMLALTVTAMAESVPSKATSDLTKIEVTAENIPADSGFVMQTVVEDNPVYQRHVEACKAEIAKLADSQQVEVYFGEVKDSEGNAVSLKEVLGADTLNVFEFCPMVVDNYEESYGAVTATMLFSTPYAAGEKVVVMVGLVTVNADGTQSVEWFAYEGVGVAGAEGETENMGRIQVEFDPAIIQAIQEGTALLAVVSK